MKVLILSDINSAHTQKWTIAMSKKGITVGIFSLSAPLTDWFSEHGIIANEFNAAGSFPDSKNQLKKNGNYKIGYLKALPKIKTMIRQFNPDILHAHYATSYGLLGALTKFHPFVITAWGSDVMDFPNKSFLHKAVLKYNFDKADSILATSDALVTAIKPLTNKAVNKIPFGIDAKHFKPVQVESVFLEEQIVVGAVKSLEEIYGIDILIKAFKIAAEKRTGPELRLLIVGDGSKTGEYKTLVKDSGLEDKVIFTGKIEYDKVVNYHNMIDIFVNVSRNESFGVSVLEASACGKPVIASNIGGLPEVVINNETGILVERENIAATSAAIEKLAADKKLREKMGEQGHIMVKEKFDLDKNMDALSLIYNQMLSR